jgi:ubiquinone/menaquinone biosynthesis C-methylase UbiE/DNA-binding transcriptional ArsR family regulator
MTDLLPIFKSLADESRLRIVHALSHSTFNVQELTSILELSQPTISHHLKILQQAHVVSVSRQATWAYYSLPTTLSDTLSTKQNGVKQILKSFLAILSDYGSNAVAPFDADLNRLKEVSDKRRNASKQFFDGVAAHWKDLRQEETTDQGPLQELLKRLDPNLDLVDLGCGSGVLLERIVPRNGKTIAVDYSQAMLEEAVRVLGDKRKEVDLRLGYLEHLPLADHSVDIAVAHMVLHHLVEPQRALADIRRIVRPNGSCLIVDLNEHNREYMRERYADHWLGFNPDQLKHWAHEAGFLESHYEFFGEQQEAFLLTLQ